MLCLAEPIAREDVGGEFEQPWEIELILVVVFSDECGVVGEDVVEVGVTAVVDEGERRVRVLDVSQVGLDINVRVTRAFKSGCSGRMRVRLP